jgi:hypothetical protein
VKSPQYGKLGHQLGVILDMATGAFNLYLENKWLNGLLSNMLVFIVTYMYMFVTDK